MANLITICQQLKKNAIKDKIVQTSLCWVASEIEEWWSSKAHGCSITGSNRGSSFPGGLGTTAERRTCLGLSVHQCSVPRVNKAAGWQGADLKQGQVVTFLRMNQSLPAQ